MAETSRELLDRRLAAGEITLKEYEELVTRLSRASAPSEIVPPTSVTSAPSSVEPQLQPRQLDPHVRLPGSDAYLALWRKAQLWLYGIATLSGAFGVWGMEAIFDFMHGGRFNLGVIEWHRGGASPLSKADSWVG